MVIRFLTKIQGTLQFRLQDLLSLSEILTSRQDRPHIDIRSGSVTSDQECQQCGRCCERWGWGQNGIVEDLIPWLTSNRQDILRHVSIRYSDGSRSSGSTVSDENLLHVFRIRYWQDTEGTLLHHCPFLWRSKDGKAMCAIHDCKPAVCRGFTPWTWQNHEFYGNCPACRERTP